MAQLQAQMAEHGAAFFAWYQHSGKGQRGKKWTATRGENLMMSVVLNPAPLTLENQFLLTMAVALGCYDLFAAYAHDDTAIKWANDIYWKDRKAGGILIENIIQGSEWKYAVAGMGVNINQTLFSEALPNAVSLKQITGKTFDVLELAKELCVCLDDRWNQLASGNHQQIIDDYNTHLYKRDSYTVLIKNGKHFAAKVNRVNDKGELIIDDNRPISFGSVEWWVP